MKREEDRVIFDINEKQEGRIEKLVELERKTKIDEYLEKKPRRRSSRLTMAQRVNKNAELLRKAKSKLAAHQAWEAKSFHPVSNLNSAMWDLKQRNDKISKKYLTEEDKAKSEALAWSMNKITQKYRMDPRIHLNQTAL